MGFDTLSNENVKLFDHSKTEVVIQRTENETKQNIYMRHSNSMHQPTTTNQQTSGV